MINKTSKKNGEVSVKEIYEIIKDLINSGKIFEIIEDAVDDERVSKKTMTELNGLLLGWLLTNDEISIFVKKYILNEYGIDLTEF